MGVGGDDRHADRGEPPVAGGGGGLPAGEFRPDRGTPQSDADGAAQDAVAEVPRRRPPDTSVRGSRPLPVGGQHAGLSPQRIRPAGGERVKEEISLILKFYSSFFFVTFETRIIHQSIVT